MVLSLDKILNSKPSNEAAINAYIKIILDLANDTDPKIMDTVIDSFKRNVFDKIEFYEQSPSLKHVHPWRLLKSMLNCRDSPDFRISVQKWMNRNLLKYEEYLFAFFFSRSFPHFCILLEKTMLQKLISFDCFAVLELCQRSKPIWIQAMQPKHGYCWLLWHRTYKDIIPKGFRNCY